MKMNPHPASELFPLMEQPALRELADNIRRNGLLNPIVTHEGMVLDGRNRLRACELVGVRPTLTPFGGGSPTEFVLAQNLSRRHLTTVQKAFAAERSLPLLEAEARERRRLAPMGARVDPEKIPEHGEAREIAAKAAGVNPRYVSDAKAIRERAPEVAAAAEAGKLRMREAKRLAEIPDEEVRREAMENVVVRVAAGRRRDAARKRKPVSPPASESGPLRPGTYRAIVVNTPDDISLGDLLALPIAEMAYGDCVLWLWVPPGRFGDALACLNRFGFIERQLVIWDRAHGRRGPLFLERSSHCLVATRGNPSVSKSIVPNIVTGLAKGLRPENFYRLIESVCQGTRLEIFSTRARLGWSQWNPTSISKERTDVRE